MCFWDSFGILPGLGVHCLLALWRLPVSGQVARLITARSSDDREVVADGACWEVHWLSGSGPGRKRIRLNRKTPAHLAGYVIHSRPRVWKRLRHVGHSSVSIPDHKRRRSDQNGGECSPSQVRTGAG